MDKRSTKMQTVETMCEEPYIPQNRRKQQIHKNQQFVQSFNDQTCVLLMNNDVLTSVYNVHLKRWLWSLTNIKRTHDRSILTKARFTSYPLRIFRKDEETIKGSVPRFLFLHVSDNSYDCSNDDCGWNYQQRTQLLFRHLQPKVRFSLNNVCHRPR